MANSENADRQIEDYFVKRRQELQNLAPLLPIPIATQIINQLQVENELLMGCFKNSAYAGRRINQLQNVVTEVINSMQGMAKDEDLRHLKSTLEELKRFQEEKKPLFDFISEAIAKRKEDMKKTTPGTT